MKPNRQASRKTGQHPCLSFAWLRGDLGRPQRIPCSTIGRCAFSNQLIAPPFFISYPPVSWAFQALALGLVSVVRRSRNAARPSRIPNHAVDPAQLDRPQTRIDGLYVHANDV
jgi:hypothetical protein